MRATEGSCSLFHGQTHQICRVSAAPDAKNVHQGTVMCRILSHEPCAHACKSLLTPGGREHVEATVGALSLPVNQHVIGMRHIYSHAPHAKAPTCRETPTAGMPTHIWSQSAAKLAHAAACTQLQRARAKILCQPHAKVPAAHATRQLSEAPHTKAQHEQQLENPPTIRCC